MTLDIATSQRIAPATSRLWWKGAVQNIIPARWRPTADHMPEAGPREFLRRLERVYMQEAARLPEHSTYIRKFAPMNQQGTVA